MTHPEDVKRVRTVLFVLLAFVPFMVVACNTDGTQVDEVSGGAPAEVDGAVVGTAEAAAGDAQAGDAEAGVAQESADVVSQAEALATLNHITGGEAGLPGSEPGAEGPAPMSDEAQATFVAAQATTESQAGIADVDSLVLSMMPLATFTPAPGGADVSGKLTYVRAGRFYQADASGGPGEVLSEDLPRVWSPPEDPGRAWTSPDGERVAFFGGPDAEVWVMDRDGDNAHAVSLANLPTDTHVVTTGGQRTDARLRPGTDYTFVVKSGDDAGVIVLTDDNSRHIRGESRLRVVHASEAYEDTPIVANHLGEQIADAIEYGEASDNVRVLTGPIRLQLTDAAGSIIASLPEFTAADRDLKTVFVYGDDTLAAAQFDYQPGQPPSGHSRVRVFNASDRPVDVSLDDGLVVVAAALPSGSLGDYVDVLATLSVDARQDAELALYGLRAGEAPVNWSTDGDRVAFVGFGDGQADLYAAEVEGEAVRVTSDESREVNPIWSPDGKRLVWESIDEATDQHRVGWMDADGSVSTVDHMPIITEMGWSSSAAVKYPEAIAWADNDTVFFYPQADGQSSGIWLFDADRGGLRQIFAQPLTDVEFSPEAKRWAVVSSETPGEVVVVDMDGKTNVVASGEAWAPDWSPDGRQISWVEGDRLSPVGWRIHVVNADGSNDRALTDWLPVLQTEPPVPGPNAKRAWLDDGRRLAFTRAGRDYGAAERAGIGGAKAGDDIENMWIALTDGSEPPVQATDLTRVFYLREPTSSSDGDTLALVGFSYLDRVQWLWTLPLEGGKPQKIDGGVRWYEWDQ